MLIVQRSSYVYCCSAIRVCTIASPLICGVGTLRLHCLQAGLGLVWSLVVYQGLGWPPQVHKVHSVV